MAKEKIKIFLLILLFLCNINLINSEGILYLFDYNLLKRDI